MVFESQAKADNFIRYNKEEIEEENGRAPVRSYYCKLCGGWHVTSKMSEAVMFSSDKRDERIMAEVDEFSKSHEDIQPYLMEADEKLKVAELMILQGRINEAEQLLRDWRKRLNPFRHCTGDKHFKWEKRDRQIEELLEYTAQIKMLDNMSIEQRSTILDKDEQTKEEKAFCQAYRNMCLLRKVEELIAEADKDIENGRKDVEEKLSESRKVLKLLDCQFKKVILKERRKAIAEREEKAIELGLISRPVKVVKKLIRRGCMEYREAILFLIEKFEDLQKQYEDGDMDECESILETIDYGLDELQQSDKTEKLRELYESWKNKL